METLDRVMFLVVEEFVGFRVHQFMAQIKRKSQIRTRKSGKNILLRCFRIEKDCVNFFWVLLGYDG